MKQVVKKYKNIKIKIKKIYTKSKEYPLKKIFIFDFLKKFSKTLRNLVSGRRPGTRSCLCSASVFIAVRRRL